MPITSSKAQISSDLREKAGITNDFAIAAICAKIEGEGGYTAKVEQVGGYANTSATRIKQVFGFMNASNGFTDDVIDKLKKDTQAFTDTIYGGRSGPAPQNYRRRASGGGPFLGNSELNDGYKYRGRGFIQITGKSVYQSVNNNMRRDGHLKSGVDLVNNPDILVDDYETSFWAMVTYLKYNGVLTKRNINTGEYGVRSTPQKAYANGIDGMNDFTSQLQANTALVAAIGGSANFPKTPFGVTVLQGVNARTGTSGTTGSPSPVPVADGEALQYIIKTYTDPLKALRDGADSPFFDYLQDKLTDKLVLSTKRPDGSSSGNRTFKEYLEQDGIYRESQLDGEIALLNLAAEAQVKLQAQQATIRQRIDDLPSAAAAFLIQNNLFELSPDLMRGKMAANAGASFDLGAPTENYSHAWRSPGKLAITADLTIPGASGFRIGQIFRVGRTYDHYNRYGAFQLFGLTEEISVGRGWTTTIHSRFNAMPVGKITGVKSF